jgi:hypothetical protein
MAEIVREVTEHVAKDFGTTPDKVGSAERLDKFLRLKQPVRLFGKDSTRSIDDYIKIGQKRAMDPILKLIQSVGAPGVIDNIILVGGGSAIYKDPSPKNFLTTISRRLLSPYFPMFVGFN